MQSDTTTKHVIVLSGHRRLNKRLALFVEGVLKECMGCRIWSLPRGNWSLQRFECLQEQPDVRRFEIRCLMSRESRLGAVLCFHWMLLPFAVLIGLLRRVPVLYDEHDHYELNTRERDGSPMINRLSSLGIRFVHSMLLRHVTLITCIHMANDVLKTRLMAWQPNVIELHNYPVREWRNVNRARIDDAPLHFLYMGGVFAEKGVNTAVAAFCSLPEAIRNRGQLDIFGSGDRQLMQNLTQKPGVNLHNNVSPEELRQFAGAHRCCGLVLYRQHPRYQLIGTNSRKLYEYLATGMPVICTAVGEIPNFVREHQVGVVIEAGFDERELRQAMTRMLDSAALWSAMAQNARQLMSRDEMTWEHEWQKVVESGILGQPQKGSSDRMAA